MLSTRSNMDIPAGTPVVAIRYIRDNIASAAGHVIPLYNKKDIKRCEMIPGKSGPYMLKYMHRQYTGKDRHDNLMLYIAIASGGLHHDSG